MINVVILQIGADVLWSKTQAKKRDRESNKEFNALIEGEIQKFCQEQKKEKDRKRAPTSPENVDLWLKKQKECF